MKPKVYEILPQDTLIDPPITLYGVTGAPFLPMISDCLVLPPEGPISRLGMITAMHLLLTNVVLTWRWAQQLAASLPPDTMQSSVACLMSDRVDLALGIVAVCFGYVPMMVSELEEELSWSQCEFSRAERSSFNCTLMPPRGAIPWGNLCLAANTGFKWHSTCAGLFFLLYLVYVWRISARCVFFRHHGIDGSPSKRSVVVKLVCGTIFCIAILIALNLSGPWATRKKWTAIMEWTMALCVEGFVLSCATDLNREYEGRLIGLEELLWGGGVRARAAAHNGNGLYDGLVAQEKHLQQGGVL